MSLKHGKVSSKPSSADTTKVRAKDWGSNETNYATDPTHVFDGGNLGDLLYRDTGAVDGASWLTGAAGVLVGGVGAAPEWRALSVLLDDGTKDVVSLGFADRGGNDGLFYDAANGGVAMSFNGDVRMQWDGGSVRLVTDFTMAPAAQIHWGASSAYGSTDTSLARTAAAIIGVTNAFQFPERSDPAAPASNNAVLYARDNGSGKTELVVRFPTGAIQVIKTEP